ncbi:MAG TPA: energy transducer TonB [candidate division WOR-3 bacterium]|uniref:Energy transducer TonB n=1 Tax=candidate division WOR-3 bacterium TaxID=2052148 RepID=A0A9C9ELS5_UNCW3|nr:energy transducer TonB [candidate division WOR-3 bacterium]
MFRNKRLDLGIIISIIIHILLFILMSGSSKSSGISYEDIKEVTLIDQSYRPEVAKVISKGSVWSDIKETYSESEQTSYGGGEIVTPAIDLDVKMDRSQAKIDLDRYMTNNGDVGDVIRIGSTKNGTMKSTEEILAEKPISLAKNLPRGAGGEGGVGIGGGNIGRKAQVPAIKIDKKPPPPKTSQIGKKVEKQVETKLKVEKGGTQISLAGPIANRQILSKILPKYPAWCLRKGISGVVKIRIWVEPSGCVREGTLIEVSSGYPDLDQAVIKALRLWKFAPLPSNVVQETQWGIITFRFVCG